jgi:hypothetical protein
VLAEADGPRRGLYLQLLGLAQPWLVLAAFEVADREILLDLWLRCREVGRELGGGVWLWDLRRGGRHLPAALLLAALLSGAAWGAARYGRHALRLVDDEYRPLLLAARRFENVTLLAAGAMAVVALGIYLVSRVARG